MPPSPEPIAFAGGTLERAVQRRTDADWLEEQLADPQARAIVVRGATADPEPRALTLDGRDEEVYFLGLDEHGPLFAVGRAEEGLPGLRDLASTLPGARIGLLAYAAALVHWNRSTRFCGRCGERAALQEGGHARTCANGHTHHPRTDPVVIMLVTDGDRVLLGRQATWPPGRYSALAGFVEPGESLESAVAREVREEAGVEVVDVTYVDSQPWPFPASLMLGFHARWAGGAEPAVGDEELEDVRWFSRAELLAAGDRDVDWLNGAGVDGFLLPPPTAIARLLIDRWLTAPTG